MDEALRGLSSDEFWVENEFGYNLDFNFRAFLPSQTYALIILDLC